MSGARLIGIDLARLVAVAGMMGAHTLSVGEPQPAAVTALVDGPPSTLFAVLGGVSVVLAARARLAAGERSAAVRATLGRGAVVALLGLLVIPFAAAVYVVLVPFGVAIVLAAGLLLLPSWALAALAVVLATVGGWIAAFARLHLPGLEGTHGILSLAADPLGTLIDVTLSGVYPVLTWVTYVAIGMLVARALLAARAAARERRALVAVGAIGAVLIVTGVLSSELGLRMVAAGAGGGLALDRSVMLANGYGAAPGIEPVLQLIAAPHTGTPADIARTVGMALVVIAALGLLAAALPPRALRLLEPLRAAGAAPLTIYVLHVVLLTLLGSTLSQTAPALVGGWGAWALQLGVALAIGGVLAASRARGPLELLVGAAAVRAAGARDRALPR
ncbi:heparan-alpha-glucosaminide N-acetyltransferase domain-containing protein [Agrococcus sp. Marseille-P2731]|uniref:heparan-alpha-glucosaminide N-acetyltransferase domain-containing protein n=1 Tax=Agrococcus sp. Marseille-P2731 TaxID=1841862 RepID=UPI0009301BCC|nr:heparan-alpha-glucosaminide N-acetyltransferase domain-containing protein [Agrococcus sp. Marseille-P2731]